MDPIAQFKEGQRTAWAGFGPLESVTGTVAPQLVEFAGISRGAEVLDVACGTGVVALTAARLGARVTGIDLTPELVARAKENAAILQVEATWHEGDAEALPFPDGRFDFVVSQFGHMFAPRPDVVVKEMLRVLKPGRMIAFSTWPPELFVGRMFALTARYAPPPPPGVSPPPQWGDPSFIRERLGAAVKDLAFTRGTMQVQTLSPQHYRRYLEANIGTVTRLVQSLESSDAPRLATFRREFEELAAIYFEPNWLRQDFLITRAIKA